MTNYNFKRMEMLKQKFEQSTGLPFRDVLEAEAIEAMWNPFMGALPPLPICNHNNLNWYYFREFGVRDN
ncbi:hypothetical protein [Pseudanabaena sp. PCC 6802]|uniref:hypothetical protein n=1 Tax=Pseudanabaena sp. PCC 6802 TaxID=118173 RepID=UPI00034A4536|nr:hypothetical protein [Pseudanabaena sp. PCC 6802]